ncbi:hypothetical protein QAC11_01125 [Staphylococcus aureus]|uniref:hypothetical protein n=1 Tax=Staphylococcus TaxID=1279 RepID=UPI00044EF547|nr:MULTISPECIES: hypothetical protein [Staphylococcus]ATY56461.1 hypothetical protein CJ017_04105 [Staphylococcus argenteus]ATZ86704.1 hypothetical protein CKO49_04125 [Staphylococcus argenteus]EKI2451416.1 hypothetical protein [Staphylococcus aureus]EKV6571886.1 hypothetical protein [Staphylococcus aureus]EKW9247497.1 hypothetical protein [Staphylococcus aureus]
MEKSNKELASELVIAMLEHNAKLTKSGVNGNPISSSSIINGEVIVNNLKYIKDYLDRMDD